MAQPPVQLPQYQPGSPPPYLVEHKKAPQKTDDTQEQSKTQKPQSDSTAGGMLESAIRSGKELVGGIAKEFINEVDRYAVSPLLDCFKPGSAVQLRSKASHSCVRVHSDGTVDALGIVGEDYSAHFVVVKREQNIVILRNGAYPNHHLSMLNDAPVGTGVGDRESKFRMHETSDHYLNLEHEMTGKRFGFYENGEIASSPALNSFQDGSMFEVILVYSPYGHVYTPAH